MKKMILVVLAGFFMAGCVTTSKLVKESHVMYQKGVQDTMKSFNTCVAEGRKLEQRYNEIAREHAAIVQHAKDLQKQLEDLKALYDNAQTPQK